MKVLLPLARSTYSRAGARVDESEEIVRIPRELVRHARTSPPAEMEILAPLPEFNMKVGGQHVAAIYVGGPPNATDLVRGKRAGTLADLAEFSKLAQSFDVIHLLAPCVEPQVFPWETSWPRPERPSRQNRVGSDPFPGDEYSLRFGFTPAV